MSIAVIVALLSFAPAQESAPPAPPAPPAPAEGAPAPIDPAPVEEPPPVVELAPTAPPVVAPPVVAPPVVEPPTPDKKPAPVESQGIGAVGVGALQLAVGTGACCAGCCLSIPFAFGLGLIPVVGGVASSAASSIVVGTTIGVAETWAGDAWGQQRAAMLWPVVASVGILMSSTALSAVARIVEPTPLPDPSQIDPSDPAALAAAFGAGGGPVSTVASFYSLFACVGSIALPAIAYAITAVDKQPGDAGGFPGVMEPARPMASASPAPERTIAMRY